MSHKWIKRHVCSVLHMSNSLKSPRLRERRHTCVMHTFGWQYCLKSQHSCSGLSLARSCSGHSNSLSSLVWTLILLAFLWCDLAGVQVAPALCPREQGVPCVPVYLEFHSTFLLMQGSCRIILFTFLSHDCVNRCMISRAPIMNNSPFFWSFLDVLLRSKTFIVVFLFVLWPGLKQANLIFLLIAMLNYAQFCHSLGAIFKSHSK